jgi:hypothetical protein
LETHAGQLRIVFLGEPWKEEEPQILAWVERAALAQGHLFDGLPEPELVLLVLRDPEQKQPFGYVVRGGGPMVVVTLPSEVSVQTLRDDWVLVHELTHVGVPDIQRSDAWLAEGIATYYTYLLRARAGLISREQAWANLFDGFARGASRATGHALSYDSVHMHEQRAYWRVYWAGALFVLEADIALRARGKSFDDALREAARCCLNGDTMSAKQILKSMDGWLGEALLVPLSEQHLSRRDFSGVAELRDLLGVSTSTPDQCRLDDGADGAKVRTAIAAPSPRILR